jgi:outer membrane protein assembly factor BamE (lipoprotein component of BamABCDE complex)
MKTLLQTVLTMVALLTLTACATTIGRDYDQGKVSQFVPGQTTMAQVIAALGQPQERETESDGSVRFHYQYIVSKNSVGDYVPFAPVKADTAGKDTFLYFDAQGRFLRAENDQSNQ